MHSPRQATGEATITGADRRARFDSEVLVHLEAAYRFARWLCRDVCDAEDVVQEAALRAFRSFDTTTVTDPRAWLLAIVRNCQLTAARRKQAGPGSLAAASDGEELLNAVPDPSPDPEERAAEGQTGRLLRRLLARLPGELREVLVLRELEELSYREIAAVTSIPMGTVMSRLFRARAALKVEWEQAIAQGHHDVP